MSVSEQAGTLVAALYDDPAFCLDEIPDNPDAVDAAYCLRFLRALRDVAFATVDKEGLPAVRVIDVMAVTEDRLYFVAARGKAFYREVMDTRQVALVGLTGDYRTCRLRGRVERPGDAAVQRALVDRIFELNPSMAELYSGDARYVLEAFWVERGQGEYYDLGRKPLLRVPFALGEQSAEAGFLITASCVGCGACAAACPARCIAERSAVDRKEGAPPFAIEQSSCLRCGLCQETCPHSAITRRG